jgi:signal transduction histidine kinase
MNRLKWIIALSLGALAAFIVWIGVGQPRLWQARVEDRVYRIGYEDQPPLHFLGKDGRAAGLAVELVAEAARRGAIRLQWQLEPEGSEAALKAKKVDLWPMMTVRPERRGFVYISDPYREFDVCLLVRRDSRYARPKDLRDSTIAYTGSPLDVRVLRPLLANAQFLAIKPPKENLEAVCGQRVDAAYFTEYFAVATLMAGISCGGQGLRPIQLPDLRGQVGVGATFEARPAADAIRKVIGEMTADGTFAEIEARWGSLSGRNLELADSLIRSRRRERWLIAGISSAVLLLLLMLWQGATIRRAQVALGERNRELTLALTAAREATELKSQFLANMSHEIRTPMNAILGMTAVAMETLDREEEREYLNDVMRSGASLLSLLNDILDFSKIEAGKVTFDRVDFDPADVARGVCTLLEDGARTKGLVLVCRAPEPLPHEVRGDPARLRQSLVNLVGNAIKFTERGRVELDVIVDAESAHTVTLRFAVTDTGIGISEESQRRIFESFAQADGSVARKYGGTGLGLSISKQLIARMGGELRVDSTPGRGSTFWFILPFEKAHGKGAGAAEDRSDSKTDS